jgi:hypothetical protein
LRIPAKKAKHMTKLDRTRWRRLLPPPRFPIQLFSSILEHPTALVPKIILGRRIYTKLLEEDG